MANFWANNGEPLADGRLCYIVDPEDGSQPIKTYGRTKDEVLAKVGKSLETGQKYITQQREQLSRTSAPSSTPQTTTEPTAQRMTPEQVMTRTADLNDPKKAGGAIVDLVKDATGIDLNAAARHEAERRLGDIAEEWAKQHPEFPAGLTAKKLLLNTAVLNAGGIRNVTAQTFERTYQSLLGQGAFAESYEPEPEEVNPSPASQPPNPQVPPDGSPAPRTTVRPRGVATSFNSRRSHGTPPAAQPPAPKYTRAQIDGMSADELAEKMKSESGFAELVASYSRPSAPPVQVPA